VVGMWYVRYEVTLYNRMREHRRWESIGGWNRWFLLLILKEQR
jgi:hypothetical protein